jgi:hypothetical protein
MIPLTASERRLLDIEAATARAAWAKAQIESSGPTAALLKYLDACRKELRTLKASFED